MWPSVTLWEWLGISITNRFTSQPNFGKRSVSKIPWYNNMDWGQHISDISSKATKTPGFLCRNLAFAPRSTKEVAYKTLFRPKLEYAAPIWSPYSKLQINQVEKPPVGPAGDGETQEVWARCLMNLSCHLLRPVRIGPPCFSFIRYILVLCLKKDKYVSCWFFS